MAAGASSQTIYVTFDVTKPGRLCHTVEVSGPNIAPASDQACVNAVGTGTAPPLNFGERPKPEPGTPPPFSVKVSGPEQRVVGENAKFTIEVKNNGTTPLTNLKVVDRYDAALKPTDATENYSLEGINLAWTVDNLPPGKSTEFQVVHACEAAAAKACNRAGVTAPDGSWTEGESCLEIREAAAPAAGNDLTISVLGLTQPVFAGKELTYLITVTNKGRATYQQVSVTATAPEGMTLDLMRTSGPPDTKFNREGQIIRFDPVAQITSRHIIDLPRRRAYQAARHVPLPRRSNRRRLVPAALDRDQHRSLRETVMRNAAVRRPTPRQPPGRAFRFHDRDCRCVKTWALPHPPDLGNEMPCEALPDHRLTYLDYEGPVSGQRGSVTRWDRGTCTIHRQSDSQWVVELAGEKLTGEATLCRLANNPSQWAFSFASKQPE